MIESVKRSPEAAGSRVGDHEQGGGPGKDAAEALTEGLGVKRRKAFVEDDEVGVMQECSGDVETAPLTVRQLPACLADHLQHLSWHPVKQISEAELAANGVSLSHIVQLWRPAPAHQQIEGEGAGEDMVLMELRCSYYPPPPALGPERLSV